MASDPLSAAEAPAEGPFDDAPGEPADAPPDGAAAASLAPARRVRMASVDDAGALPDGCLLVDQFGSFVGKKGERLRILMRGEVVAERALLGLEHVLVLANGVGLSTDAIRACAESGIQISLVSRSGKTYARLLAPELTGTVQTRRHQLLA